MWPFSQKQEQHTLCEDDWVLLYAEDENTFLVQLKAGKVFHMHKGIVPFDECIGKTYGERVVCPKTTIVLLEPTIEDFMMKVKRRTNIIYPKDAAMILMKSGLCPGKRVIEVGTGSGSMLIALANTVSPGGNVYAYDMREEFLRLARSNLSRCVAVKDAVEFKERQENTPFDEKNVDCVIMDIPVPWVELPYAKEALKPGGHIVSLNPTYNQVERMGQALRDEGFVRIECLELLLRPILARTGKTRPVQHMVGHTEFLLFAVKTNSNIL